MPNHATRAAPTREAAIEGTLHAVSAVHPESALAAASASAEAPRAAIASQNAATESRGLGANSPHAIIGVLCAIAVILGPAISDWLQLTAASGAGYWLGIFGLAAMALLLTYSLRKRLALMRNAGSMRAWFEMHLILGLLGPTAILYHANFELSSLNSTVALACMLAVAGSGVGGRFLYGRMHRSLAGDRRTVGGLLKAARDEIGVLEPIFAEVPESRALLERFVADAARVPHAVLTPVHAVRMRLLAWRRKRLVLTTIAEAVKPRRVSPRLEAVVSRCLGLACRGVELRLFERLFSLWHAIHVPLSFLLFLSAAVHVLAVHLY